MAQIKSKSGIKVRNIKPRNIPVLLLLLMLPACFSTQHQSRKVRQAVKNAERVEERQKKAYEKARKKEIKRRFNMQTPEVQERMKESRKKAREFNRQNREPFFKRILKKLKLKRHG
ncbi:MAG TPA: hypothetical protein ENF21_05020 [Bacteroidetes bacterium]|nr:hypothetical protein [Bacteroidota bacterium]